MVTYGVLTDTGVLVENPREASRLHSKSQYGTPLNQNHLLLDTIEAAYLVSEHKLTIHINKKTILTFEDFFKLTTQKNPHFDSLFLIYRDLRKRGYALKKTPKPIQGFIHHIKKSEEPKKTIYVFTEHDQFSIKETQEILITAKTEHSVVWYGIVDEEGDLTYYEVSYITPQGNIHQEIMGSGQATLLENRVVLFDKDFANELHQKEFYGKPFSPGLQLSIIEAIYLMKKNHLTIKTIHNKKISATQLIKQYQKIYPDLPARIQVFEKLKHQGLIVKTGYKFGAHFRAYTHRPEKTHAEYLIHVVGCTYKERWSDISRAIRLAHSVNKEILFSYQENNETRYIKIGRLRP
ncbi:MAG: tRNA-intron lyase [Candidatus Thermoplasmatota archaeon]|nr:tRNA-intron lyase [Candidatus Thermoplasmatota archaeon]